MLLAGTLWSEVLPVVRKWDLNVPGRAFWEARGQMNQLYDRTIIACTSYLQSGVQFYVADEAAIRIMVNDRNLFVKPLEMCM